jgi:multiple sugar transport system permease protein
MVTRNKIKAKAVAPYLFILPAVILTLLLSVFPILYSFYISLLKYRLLQAPDAVHFIWFENYKYILTDKTFLNSIRWTFVFAFFVVTFNVVLGMIIALLLNNKKISNKTAVFKSLIILPMMISPVVSATVWQILFGAIYSPINYIIQLVGFEPLSWIGSEKPAKFAIIMIDIWAATPFCVLIFLAALKTVSQSLYEAALIDGASRVGAFFRITLPSIRNFIALVVTIRVMDALRVFDTVMILTKGGPGTATETIGSMIYKTAFRYSNIGAGSAGAFIFFIIIAVITLLLMKVLRRETSIN